MTLAAACLRLLRRDLHARAYALHSQGHSEAAQALWGVVESIDGMLNRLDARRRP